MSSTPTKTTDKRLPMIVDIALDPNGKQLYQVHELLKLVRKEMPRLTNFTSQTLIPEEEKTPIRKILGTILPLTLNQKKSELDLESYHHESSLVTGVGRKVQQLPVLINDQFHGDSSALGSHGHEMVSSDGMSYSLKHEGSSLDQSGYSDYPTPVKNNDDTDIWSSDVEAAFEEVLLIIPKNGLLKIKISGRSCGRNELISDYILQKTGKFRTRKQVSSHIQVIKNLGQKLEIIRLINDGPIFKTDKERIENMEKFETIFLKITLAKLMGVSDNIGNKRLQPGSGQRHSYGNINPLHQQIQYPMKRRNNTFSIENFYLSIVDSTGNNFNLSRQSTPTNIKNLKLNPDANLSGRFPGLSDLADLDTPFIHNMVKMKVPSLNGPLQSLQSNIQLRNTNPELGNQHPYGSSGSSIFSCAYLYGQEVLKTNEPARFNDNTPFLPKFWEFFFKELFSRGSVEDVVKALKGVTIKQIVYDNEHDESKKMIAKLQIQAVLLWEFCGVDSYNDALNTISLLSFPQQVPFQQMPYVQLYGYQHQFGSELHSTGMGVASSGQLESTVIPQVVEYAQPSYQQQVNQYGGPFPVQLGQQTLMLLPLSVYMSQNLPLAVSRSGISTAQTLAVKSEYGYFHDGIKSAAPGNNHSKYPLQESYQFNQPQHPYGGNYLHASANVDLMLEAPSTTVHYFGQEQPVGYSGATLSFGAEQGTFMNNMDNSYIGK